MLHLKLWLLERKRLLEGGAYFNAIPKSAGFIRERRLFEVWRVLGEMRYLGFVLESFNAVNLSFFNTMYYNETITDFRKSKIKICFKSA